MNSVVYNKKGCLRHPLFSLNAYTCTESLEGYTKTVANFDLWWVG